MAKNKKVDLVVVGSIALDDIATQTARRRNVLGGSVSFACAAASFFSSPGMVGVIGSDFHKAHIQKLEKFGIDLSGLKKEAGKTFRWSGVYERNMNNRRTISTDLNVFASFSPELPDAYKSSKFLFLANIAPNLQLNVLRQMKDVKFTAADTMDLWINTARAELMKVISKVDLLLINESEVRELTREENLIKAAAILLKKGPRYLVIKKGEHGGMLISRDFLFLMPAFPVATLRDPTGAGDAFAGGMMGVLSKSSQITPAVMKKAMITGAVTASFAVESFGLDKLGTIKRSDIKSRTKKLLSMTQVPSGI